MKQADGETDLTFAFASYKLDYIFASQAIVARGGVRSEVYNSRLESSFDGVPKRVSLPSPALSGTASDHYAIVADIPLLAQPRLRVTFSRDTLVEGETGLTATVSATPAPATGVRNSAGALTRLK